MAFPNEHLTSTKSPIKILGAGPSGLAAAIVLALQGRNVIVHERRGKAGGRFHDDYQGLENWSSDLNVVKELASVGIRSDFECEPVFAGTVFNTRLKAALVRSEDPFVYLVRRGSQPGSLDSSLARQASDAGVELRFDSTLPIDEANIVAGGPTYPREIAVGINFETDMGNTASAIVGDSLAPRGYSYLLVGSSRGTLATVLFEDFRHARDYLRRTIEAYVKLLGLRLASPVEWGGYGDFRLPRTAMKDGRLYVGEAAGFQDFLFGFGIRIAMLSGILAAKSILYEVDYDRLWRNRLLSIIVSSRLNRIAYSKLRKVAYDLLWLALKNSREPHKVMRRLYTWWPSSLPYQHLASSIMF